jgi:hypothetical protein
MEEKIMPISILKNTWLIIAFLIIVLATSGYSQMGHGMMRGGHMMEGGGHMMGGHMMKGDERGHEQGMMRGQISDEHRRVMNGMMSAMQDIAIMMRQMSVMMGDITSEGSNAMKSKMKEMSALLKDMAAEMNRISGMIGGGPVSDEDVRTMQKRVMDLQERIWEVRK